MGGHDGAMMRFLALLSIAVSAPLSAAPLPRSFTVTSFDRVRVEGPYAVTLTTGRAPFARAEGPATALDAIDLRVEGRTLVLRRRSGAGSGGAVGPVRIALGSPEVRAVSLSGAGSLEVDRLSGLTVDVALVGSGRLTVATIAADRVTGALQGSGSLRLAGRTKTARLSAGGSGSLEAGDLAAEEVTLSAEGAGVVETMAKRQATIAAAGTVQVRVTGAPACTLRIAGSAEVSGCRPQR
jgi:hypothetical protein